MSLFIFSRDYWSREAICNFARATPDASPTPINPRTPSPSPPHGLPQKLSPYLDPEIELKLAKIEDELELAKLEDSEQELKPCDAGKDSPEARPVAPQKRRRDTFIVRRDTEVTMAPRSEMSGEPPVIDPYEVLGLEQSATADEVKTAYRKAALKHHPDKAQAKDKATAHTKFQEITFAYAILSAPTRRARYDRTGRTDDSVGFDGDDFDWSDFFRTRYAEVTADSIEKFRTEYKGSEEEKDALLAAYERGKGNMNVVYERVMLSNPLEDDERFRQILDQAIEEGKVMAYKKYTEESAASKKRRLDKARKEAKEAEEAASAVAEKKKKKGGKKDNDEPNDLSSLAAMIRSRQQDRSENFLAGLEEKYASKGGKKGRKRAQPGDEPPEEAFQRSAAKAKKAKK